MPRAISSPVITPIGNITIRLITTATTSPIITPTFTAPVRTSSLAAIISTMTAISVDHTIILHFTTDVMPFTVMTG
jgi:hypothetical protein